MKVDGLVNLSLGAGKVEIKNLFAKDADLDCGVGKIELTTRKRIDKQE